MGKRYASRSAKLTPAKLTTKIFASIGRLVRACAEIEDLVTLYASYLAQVSVGHTIVLMGRTPMRTRIEIAGRLAALNGKSKQHKSIFNWPFDEIIDCRNAVAHGSLLGLTPGKKLAFLTSRTLTPTGTAVLQAVEAYSEKNITAFAKKAERKVSQIEKRL